MRSLMAAYLLIVVILLFGSADSLRGQSSLSLTYVDAELILNQHVGNEWTHSVWLNGNPLERGRAVRLEPVNRYELSVAVEETNEKYIDDGHTTRVLTADLLQKALTDESFYLDVTVTEGNGRYAGGRAVWRFYFSLK